MVARMLRWLLLLQGLLGCAIAAGGALLWHVSWWQALALGAGAVLLLRSLITCQNFALSWHFRSPTPRAFALSAPQLLATMAEEFHATMWHSSWSMVHARAGQQLFAGTSTRPVLLLHGYGCNSGYWNALVRRLDQLQISHATLDLEPVMAGIDDYVPQLHAALQALCRDSGADAAVIVAHSMGGLAARAYLRVHGNALVARVITLGTPHHGTCLANFGVGLNAMQMQRNGGQPSAWLTALARGESAQQRALITSLYSHHDNIVAPQTSCHLEGARNLAFGGVGHVALGRNRRILTALLAEITQAVAPPQARSGQALHAASRR